MTAKKSIVTKNQVPKAKNSVLITKNKGLIQSQ